jgi:replication-associated recombination protein RarA
MAAEPSDPLRHLCRAEIMSYRKKGYDRTGEERYDMISALHKCLRGSDGSAAMYWLAR